MCDLAAWVWRIAKMGPAEKLVAFDAFLAGIAGCAEEVTGGGEAAAVGVALAAGFMGFDAARADDVLSDKRSELAARSAAGRSEESPSSSDGGRAEPGEVGADDKADDGQADGGDGSVDEIEAVASVIATELRECSQSGRTGQGYDVISAVGDDVLPVVVALFVGDTEKEGADHNYFRGCNGNLAFARRHGAESLRAAFAAFFGECCQGEHEEKAMGKDWSRCLKAAARKKGGAS